MLYDFGWLFSSLILRKSLPPLLHPKQKAMYGSINLLYCLLKSWRQKDCDFKPSLYNSVGSNLRKLKRLWA